MPYNRDFETFRRITGCDDYGAYMRFEFLLDVLFGFVAAGLFLAGCIGYIVYRLWQEISLEVSYQKQYGADWQIQYERYHGSLAHAHSRLLIASLGLIALCAVFGWFMRQRIKSAGPGAVNQDVIETIRVHSSQGLFH